MLSDLQIKETCLLHGFKLKEQVDGTWDLNPYVYTAVKKCIEFNEQLKNNGWISVDDELPEPMQTVLIFGRNYKEKQVIDTGYHMPELIAEFGVNDSFSIKGFISHWQPLPSPPED